MLLDGQTITANVNAIEHLQRGWSYGDGLFETVAFDQGKAAFWDYHMQRLENGCQRLLLRLPDAETLLQEAQSLAAQQRCVIRISIVRSQGQGKGYHPDPGAQSHSHQPETDQRGSAAHRLLQRRELPSAAPHLCVDWAQLELSAQPLLAGIKHSSRLEQVLAAAELQQRWPDGRVNELLLCDAQQQLVEAISSNVMVYLAASDTTSRAAGWYTPPLDTCGVAGVMRSWLMEQGLLQSLALHRVQVEQAPALALINSVRGVQPVLQLAGRRLNSQQVADPLQAAVQEFRGF